MKVVPAVSAALLCVMLITTRGLAQPVGAAVDRDATYKTIKANYVIAATASAHKQVAPIIALQAPTFRHKLINGRIITRQQENDAMRGMMAHTQAIVATHAIQKLSIINRQAVVMLRETLKIKMQDERGKPRSINLVATVRDTWIKTSNGWKINYREELAVNSVRQAVRL